MFAKVSSTLAQISARHLAAAAHSDTRSMPLCRLPRQLPLPAGAAPQPADEMVAAAAAAAGMQPMAAGRPGGGGLAPALLRKHSSPLLFGRKALGAIRQAMAGSMPLKPREHSPLRKTTTRQQ
eukprot:159276-Chlamydomonas_euryale.AAC.1